VRIDRLRILVLNFNGRMLMEQCLPSVVRAAQAAPIPTQVTVVDNASTDDSLTWLGREWPQVGITCRTNRGLASFNPVLADCDEPAVLLLNNDVRLEENALAPLIQALQSDPNAFFAAPKCWGENRSLYEGLRTRVRMRFGLVQGRCRVPGHQRWIEQPDLTAAAGPALLVDREKFLALGGYDDLFLPGRIEDLDLGFRGWMAGWHGVYEPRAEAWHVGFASFGPAFGPGGNQRLAWRNTLIFTWKNVAGRRLYQHLAWLPARIGQAILLGRFGFLLALLGAVVRLPQVLEARRQLGVGTWHWIRRQESFFDRFAW
jgi:GT2 family glycosyltransferase